VIRWSVTLLFALFYFDLIGEFNFVDLGFLGLFLFFWFVLNELHAFVFFFFLGFVGLVWKFEE